MLTSRQLKIELSKDQNTCFRNIQGILSGLLQIDPGASILSIERAMASRSLVKKLWEILPDEHESYQFNSVEEQTGHGSKVLPSGDLTEPVTIHLGWDVLAFSCTLEAAWQSWKEYNSLDNDLYNCCIYPENLGWYIVRAGTNLYPMNYTGEKYEIIRNNNSNTTGLL